MRNIAFFNISNYELPTVSVDSFVEKINKHALTYGMTKIFLYLINNLAVALCFIYHLVIDKNIFLQRLD